MDEIILKISETSQQHVGRGRGIVDPKIIEDQRWNTGQIIELTHNKKTAVKLWPGTSEEYGTGVIKIDGITRQNLGAGIGDKISLKPIESVNAKQIVLSPTHKVTAEGLQEYMVYNYLNHVFTIGDSISLNTHMGSKIEFVVTSTSPSKPSIVTEDTIFKLGTVTKPVDSSVPRVTYDELGGLKREVSKIREMVELPMRHPELFEKIGVDAPKGVLLYGPPGTGKTLLAKAVAGETNAHFITLSGPEIMGKHYGESEERVREIFTQAKENAPSIIFIDEIDSIAPKRDDVSGELEKRIVSQLLTLMDGIESRGKVVVIAATNRPDSIDPALRRPGRFDREIEIGIPDDQGRFDILSIHTRGMPINDQDVDLQQISKITHGFVGADLEMLSKEAAMSSLRRVLPDIDLDEEKISSDILQKIQINAEDFKDALKEIRPSALREVQVQIPNVSWDDVGGLAQLKEELCESVEWPIKHKEAYDYIGAKPPKGILLYGPPGTGKTMIAKALAKMTESNFISIKGPELLSKWVGESERGVREIFRKARQAAPCIIFLDEIDALVPRRSNNDSSHVTENVVSQILTEIDGLEELHNVLVVGATNRLDIVDEAVLRPGRFDRIIPVPNPDAPGREHIFRIHTRDKPLGSDVEISRLAELADGFSGAEIAAVANRAAIAALKRYVNDSSCSLKSVKVNQQDLIDAIAKVKPQKTEEVPITQFIK